MAGGGGVEPHVGVGGVGARGVGDEVGPATAVGGDLNLVAGDGEPPVLTGAVQERSIRDGPLAVAASPVGAPGAVREMSLTLTSVPAVQERPVEGQTLPAPPWMVTPREKAREVVPSTRARVSASVKTPVEVICRLSPASSIIPMVWSVEPSVKSLSERTAVLLH